MAREVLVGTDGSPQATNAVLWAAAEATRQQVPLRIVTAHEPWYDLYAAPPELREGEEREFRENLRAAEQMVLERHPGLQVGTELVSGESAQVLGEQSESAHVVVSGTRGRGGFPGLVLGSTSRELLGHARAPVVIVPEGDLPESGGVVVGVDGTERSRAALGFAFEQAQARGTTLTAIWVIQEPSRFGPPGAYTQWRADAEGGTAEYLVEELSPWRAQFPQVQATGTVLWGHPVAMLRQAAQDAELLVVGSRGRNIARALLLGSVSHGVLHHAPCPVVIVT